MIRVSLVALLLVSLLSVEASPTIMSDSGVKRSSALLEEVVRTLNLL